MLHLPGHYGPANAFGVKGLDEARELAKRHPVDANVGVGCCAGIDRRIGLFLDGSDDDGKAVGARRVQQEKREAAIAGDQAESGVVRHFDRITVMLRVELVEMRKGLPFCSGGSKSHCAISS